MFGRELQKRQKGGRAVSALQREMNRLFEDFFGGDWSLPHLPDWFGEKGLSPDVNVSETDSEIRVSAELPGIDEKDIEVSVTRNTLSLRGEKREENQAQGQNVYHAERRFGKFERTLTLPADVETDKVSASFAKGILTVTLPKTTEAQSRSHQVKIQSK